MGYVVSLANPIQRGVTTGRSRIKNPAVPQVGQGVADARHDRRLVGGAADDGQAAGVSEDEANLLGVDVG